MNDKLKWNISHIINHYYICCRALNFRPDSDTLNCDKAMFEEIFFELSKIPDDIKLISPNVLEPMLKMKKDLDAEYTSQEIGKASSGG